MKRVTLGFSVLALTTAFVLGCKPDKNVEPVADTETESAVYASFMNFVATDIEMSCSFMAENTYLRTFYSAYPGGTQTVVVVRDTTGLLIDGVRNDQLVMAWNTTKCVDGNVRDGSIFMYVPLKTGSNDRYSRDFGWKGRIEFRGFTVNGWKVDNYDTLVPCYLYNTLTTSSYTPTSTKLTWKFAGKLRFTHPTDPTKNMVWNGELHKTLDNTSDPKVFPVSKQAAIQWSLAIVKYDGHIEGTVPQIRHGVDSTANVAYKMDINTVTPLVRDFQCSPDQVSGVAFTSTVGVITQRGDEHHPFKAGIASFTVGSNYARQIYYGNEGEPQLPAQCDNVGEVLIKGISYRVNFLR